MEARGDCDCQNAKDILTLPTTRLGVIWLRILALLALVFVVCGLKNYLVFLVSGTSLCPYLCPSALGIEPIYAYPVIREIFAVQSWVHAKLQLVPDLIARDPYKLATVLIFAPVVEEAVYRGPLYLSRHKATSITWWVVGVLLSVLFAFGHGKSGLALVPVFMLGVCSLWLIAMTQRF